MAQFITSVMLQIRAVEAKLPVCPQTKHLSLLDIMLTMDGVSMVVSCCAALNFSTILMTSDKV